MTRFESQYSANSYYRTVWFVRRSCARSPYTSYVASVSGDTCGSEKSNTNSNASAGAVHAIAVPRIPRVSFDGRENTRRHQKMGEPRHARSLVKPVFALGQNHRNSFAVHLIAFALLICFFALEAKAESPNSSYYFYNSTSGHVIVDATNKDHAALKASAPSTEAKPAEIFQKPTAAQASSEVAPTLFQGSPDTPPALEPTEETSNESNQALIVDLSPAALAAPAAEPTLFQEPPATADATEPAPQISTTPIDSAVAQAAPQAEQEGAGLFCGRWSLNKMLLCLNPSGQLDADGTALLKRRATVAGTVYVYSRDALNEVLSVLLKLDENLNRLVVKDVSNEACKGQCANKIEIMGGAL